MKLTRRQEIFIHNLLDLCRELNGPIHYSQLAERVGVSRFTAYDMLRLLEEKGLVASGFRLPVEKPTPGRSEIVFWPTEQATRLWEELTSKVGGEDWFSAKERVLDNMRNGEVRDRQLAQEMLARVPPEGPVVLRYCIEVMTIVALRLGRGTGRRLLVEYLPQILENGHIVTRASLSLLGGFALAALANEATGDP